MKIATLIQILVKVMETNPTAEVYLVQKDGAMEKIYCCLDEFVGKGSKRKKVITLVSQ